MIEMTWQTILHKQIDVIIDVGSQRRSFTIEFEDRNEMADTLVEIANALRRWGGG